MSGANTQPCSCCRLREPGPFTGWSDFDSFVSSLRNSAALTPVPIEAPYFNVGLLESWYRCSKCRGIWRLVEPDPPFAGLWERISDVV